MHVCDEHMEPLFAGLRHLEDNGVSADKFLLAMQEKVLYPMARGEIDQFPDEFPAAAFIGHVASVMCFAMGDELGFVPEDCSVKNFKENWDF